MPLIWRPACTEFMVQEHRCHCAQVSLMSGLLLFLPVGSRMSEVVMSQTQPWFSHAMVGY